MIIIIIKVDENQHDYHGDEHFHDYHGWWWWQLSWLSSVMRIILIIMGSWASLAVRHEIGKGLRAVQSRVAKCVKNIVNKVWGKKCKTSCSFVKIKQVWGEFFQLVFDRISSLFPIRKLKFFFVTTAGRVILLICFMKFGFVHP